MKGLTKHTDIQPLADAPLLCVPLSQHIGAPAVAVVRCGDRVQQGQLIGQAALGCSANVHAPVSGTVTAIGPITLAGGVSVTAVTIENDFRNLQAPPIGDGLELSLPELISAAGIVGMGGAQFPTALKYDVADRGRIKTLIVNGTECEPYLTADYALMASRTETVLRGAEALRDFMLMDEVVIVIEAQNRDLERCFSPYFHHEAYSHFRLQVLPDGYPQGGELQAIRSVIGIEVPRTQLPKTAGVVVNNVGTVCAVGQALSERRPLISRIITVSGERAGHIGNFEVKIGTPVGHILKQLGIEAGDAQLVMGGPMMGKPITDASVPIVKGSSGILLLGDRAAHRYPCISCGYCVDVCPMHLMPFQFDALTRRGRYATMADYGLMDCIECAACDYTCPSNIPLVQTIKAGKQFLKQSAHAHK